MVNGQLMVQDSWFKVKGSWQLMVQDSWFKVNVE